MTQGITFRVLLPVACWMAAVSCRPAPEPEEGRVAGVAVDASLQHRIADTIIYDVVIRHPNPDDAWAHQCLKGLDRRRLVDQVFDWIYAEKVSAYDHETREKLTPKQVKAIETVEGFHRNNIGMIQFTEAWYFRDEPAMTKEVLSMVLGYEYYTPDGVMLYKALFRVEL